MEDFNYEQMEMATPCEHCGKIFDLNDGRRSNKWHLDITICEQCGIEEMQEIEEDDIVEVANHDLGEALFDFKERGWAKITDENKVLIMQLVSGSADIPKPYKWLKEEKYKIPQGTTYNDPKVTLTQCAGWISEYIAKYYR